MAFIYCNDCDYESGDLYYSLLEWEKRRAKELSDKGYKVIYKTVKYGNSKTIERPVNLTCPKCGSLDWGYD